MLCSEVIPGGPNSAPAPGTQQPPLSGGWRVGAAPVKGAVIVLHRGKTNPDQWH